MGSTYETEEIVRQGFLAPHRKKGQAVHVCSMRTCVTAIDPLQLSSPASSERQMPRWSGYRQMDRELQILGLACR